MRSKVQILTHFSHAEKIVLEILFLKWLGFLKVFELFLNIFF